MNKKFEVISGLLNYALNNNFIAKTSVDFSKIEKLIGGAVTIENANVADPLVLWRELRNIFSREELYKTDFEWDIFTDNLASLLIGDNDWINKIFHSFEDHAKAMMWFEKLSIFTTYIKVDRIKKNIKFSIKGEYKLQITLNKSKPEKTPEKILENLKQNKTSSVLDKNQIGKKGGQGQAPRMAHRVIDMPFKNKEWFIQYSPYQYFEGHSILIQNKVTPMKVDKNALETMADFVDYLPSFNISLNADLPIVGGSILNHMHFQTGLKKFPLYDRDYKQIHDNIYKVNWPISTLLIKDTSKEKIIETSNKIIDKWKKLKSPLMPNELNGTHNSCSLTMYKNENEYFMYILLRNNYSDDEHKYGKFHVPSEYQMIKNENIGIIEASGIAIFPGRLEWGNDRIRKEVLNDLEKIKGPINTNEKYHVALGEVYKEILDNCNPLNEKYTLEKFIESLKILKN